MRSSGSSTRIDRPFARRPIADDALQDRDEPGPTVRAGLIAVKRLQRLHHGVLHDIFSVGAVPYEPQRQAEQAGRMRQHLSLECQPSVGVFA
jgi:hypothetical protein